MRNEGSGVKRSSPESSMSAEIQGIEIIIDRLIRTELCGRIVSGLGDWIAAADGRRRIQRGGECASNVVRRNGKPLELKEFRAILSDYLPL